MPLPVIPGAVRVVVAGQTQGGGRWANAWTIRTDSEITPDESGILAIHTIFRQLYVGPNLGAGFDLLTYCPSGLTLDGFGYTPLDGSSGAIFYSESATGSGSPGALPAEVTAVITVRTALRGRQNRGRVFLPQPSLFDQTPGGRVNPGMIAGALAQVVEVNNALITGGARIGVLSTGPYVGAGTPHWTAATTFSMDDRFDVQRRRKG